MVRAVNLRRLETLVPEAQVRSEQMPKNLTGCSSTDSRRYRGSLDTAHDSHTAVSGKPWLDSERRHDVRLTTSAFISLLLDLREGR